MNLLTDAKGDTSSKRIAGFTGLVLIVFIVGWGVFKDAEVANILWPVITFTGACFGFTVLEKGKQ